MMNMIMAIVELINMLFEGLAMVIGSSALLIVCFGPIVGLFWGIYHSIKGELHLKSIEKNQKNDQ